MVSARRGASRASQLVLAVATIGILHLVCWKATTPLRSQVARSLVTSPSIDHSLLAKRHVPSLPSSPIAPLEGSHEFDDEGESLIDYHKAWNDATPKQRPFVFAAFALWLAFLFAFVGITASDFFCPNLSTIATRLGLSESVAGVTFLAFSNGSPDVFSTFAALRSGSGSLAIGELIGAASFITSVVAGTMCVIEPFRVSRHSFMRDVGFFTFAVAFTLAILYDSHVHAWEAVSMVGLYVLYVIVVAVGSWWQSRKEKKLEILRQARSQYATDEEQYRDDPVLLSPSRKRSSPVQSPIAPQTPFTVQVQPPLDDVPYRSASPSRGLDFSHHHFHSPLTSDARSPGGEQGRQSSRTRSSTVSHAGHRRMRSRTSVRPSLLGAIEFRDVVNSLRADSGAKSLAVFGQDSEAFDESGSSGRRSSMPARSASQSVVQRPPLATSSNPTWSSPATADNRARGRRLSWIGNTPAVPRERCEEDHGHWGESDEEGDLIVRESPLIDLSAGVENPWKGSVGRQPLKLDIPSTAVSNSHLRRTASRTSMNSQKVPSIRLTTDEGDESTIIAPKFYAFTNRRWFRVTRAVFLSLFPSLQGFSDKSIVGKATAVLCVPAILVLNLTLPVVETEDDDSTIAAVKDEVLHEDAYHDNEDVDDVRALPRQGTLIDIEGSSGDEARHNREAVAHRLHSSVLPYPEVETLSPWVLPVDIPVAGRSEDGSTSPADLNLGADASESLHIHEDVLTRWLTAVQCLLGPIFCTVALLADNLRWWQPVAALIFGIALATFTFCFFSDPKHPGRIVLCFVGFFVAMVWILMIVNEVVGILQTLGHVFGLSDAILGLTIFAMGNSLGDLVANATVARMGFPSMAIAACFGGPMLNILLGVGLSGSYTIFTHGGQPLYIEMSRTLVVSGAGLLLTLVTTLVIVPANNFWMSKRLGVCLISAYFCILSINIAVEILWK